METDFIDIVRELVRLNHQAAEDECLDTGEVVTLADRAELLLEAHERSLTDQEVSGDGHSQVEATSGGFDALRDRVKQILRLASTRLVERGLPLPTLSIAEPHREADGGTYVLLASSTERPYAVTLGSLIAQVQALLCTVIDWELVPAADHPQLLRGLADLQILQPLIDRHGMGVEL